jgi:hypothetical protein
MGPGLGLGLRPFKSAEVFFFWNGICRSFVFCEVSVKEGRRADCTTASKYEGANLP